MRCWKHWPPVFAAIPATDFRHDPGQGCAGHDGSLAPAFDGVLLTRYRNNPRGVPIERLQKIASGLGAGHCQAYPDAAAAWEEARVRLAPEHLLCVTGSFFIAAEISREMARRPLACDASTLRPA